MGKFRVHCKLNHLQDTAVLCFILCSIDSLFFLFKHKFMKYKVMTFLEQLIHGRPLQLIVRTFPIYFQPPI